MHTNFLTLPAAGPLGAAAAAPVCVPTEAGFATAVTPEITALARALKQDADLIYEFVRNEIDFNPIWGSHKGAMGALLDKSGNDFDQASLMIALLRASGYTASYVYGQVEYSAAIAKNWLGVTDNINGVSIFLANSGRQPTRNLVLFGAGSALSSVRMERVWVKVRIGGSDYVFDPALKVRSTTGTASIATLMGYNRTALKNAALAGTTIQPTYVQNVNAAGLNSALATYSSSLVSALRANFPGKTLEEVVAGKGTIEPQLGASPSRQSNLPGQTTIYEEWLGEIPNANRACLRVALPGFDRTFPTDTLSGSRLTVFYNNNQPVLRRDGAVVATGTATPANSIQSMILGATHPFADAGANFEVTNRVTTGGKYLVLNGWTDTREGRVHHHEDRERKNQFLGGAVLDENVLGESLATFAASWLAQSSRTCELVARIGNSHCFAYHSIGVTGQLVSPYVDIPNSVAFFSHNDANTAVDEALRFALVGQKSAFEGGVLEQIAPAIDAVSTVELLGVANDTGSKIFDANSASFPAIQSQLGGTYDSNELAAVQSILNAGGRVLLPANGNLTVASWTGMGVLGMTPFNGSQVGILSYLISGALKGGYGTTQQDLDIGSDVFKMIDDYGKYQSKSADPINLVTGDFLYEASNLVVGSQPSPLGIELRTSYNAAARYRSGVMGPGWSHNWDITIKRASDGFQGLGRDSAIDASAALAALSVAADLLSSGFQKEDVVIASLVQRWLMSQLTNNTIIVSEPGHPSVFVKLADGTFSPPPGDASVLTALQPFPSLNYKLKTKNGLERQFRADGQLGFTVDPNGNQVVLNYTAGVLQSVVDAAGHTLSFGYTGGRVSSVSDGTRGIGFGYDPNGKLTTFTDANSKVTSFSYVGDGLLEKVFWPANPTNPKVVNTFNSLGQVETQADARANVWTYYIAGSRSEEVDPLGGRKIEYYDARTRLIRAVDALGFATSRQYDSENRVVRLNLPEGNYSTLEYDDKHNLTKISKFPKPGSVLPPIIREFTYEPVFSQLATDKDPRGKITRYFYDTHANLIRVEQPLVGGQIPTTFYTPNGRGQVATVTDQEGIVTKFTYDPTTADLLTKTEDFGGSPHLNLVTTFTYSAAGDVRFATDPLNQQTTFTRDNLRRVTQIMVPPPFLYLSRFQYDDDGNQTVAERQMIAPLDYQTTRRVFSLTGKVLAESDVAGQITTTAYDQLDRPAIVQDATGRVWLTQYTPRGQVAQQVDPSGLPSAIFTYTPNGKVASVTDGEGFVTGFRYDGFDRLEFTDFMNGTNEKLTYDPNDNVVQRKTIGGAVIAYSYDELNRVSTKTPDGGATSTFQYDRASRLLSETKTDLGTIFYEWDALGRLKTKTDHNNRTVGYQYDGNGNRTRLTYPNGEFVTFEYDSLNRLTKIRDGGVTQVAAYTYDALSRRTGMTRLNGAGTTWDWEIDDDLKVIIHNFIGSTASWEYGYSYAHQRLNTTISDPQFMYDLTQIPGMTYTSNTMNRLTSAIPTGGGAAIPVGTDVNGNNAASYPQANPFFDNENRLYQLNNSAGLLASYKYDSSGKRVKKTVGGIATDYVLDGNQVIEEYGSTGLKRRYVYSGLDQPVRMISYPGGASYFHQDAVGSVVALSGLGGALQEAYAYSPYGKASSTGAITSPYLFTGREYDAESNLYYYRARQYDPELGRFLQPDPLGFLDGLNPYSYVKNDPGNLIDPLGLFGSVRKEVPSSLEASFGRVFSRQMATIGGVPTGVFLSGSLTSNGNATGEIGYGLAAGNFGGRSSTGGFTWQVGSSGRLELAFSASVGVPLSGRGFFTDNRVVLDGFGVKLSGGVLQGEGVQTGAFIGPVVQIPNLNISSFIDEIQRSNQEYFDAVIDCGSACAGAF